MYLRCGVKPAGVLSAEAAVRGIDHGDGDIGDDVRGIHIVVKQPVGEDSPCQHQQDGIASADGTELPRDDEGELLQSLIGCSHTYD